MSTTAQQPLNEAKLHEFMMKAVGEMGAAMNTALILIGDKARPVQSHGRRRSDDVRGTRRQDATPPSDTFANGLPRRLPAGLSRMTPPPVGTRCLPSKRWRWPMRTARFSCPDIFKLWKPA